MHAQGPGNQKGVTSLQTRVHEVFDEEAHQNCQRAGTSPVSARAALVMKPLSAWTALMNTRVTRGSIQGAHLISPCKRRELPPHALWPQSTQKPMVLLGSAGKAVGALRRVMGIPGRNQNEPRVAGLLCKAQPQLLCTFVGGHLRTAFLHPLRQTHLQVFFSFSLVEAFMKIVWTWGRGVRKRYSVPPFLSYRVPALCLIMQATHSIQPGGGS